MNKKMLSVAVVLGLSGAASAVNVNPDGLGQALLFPFYTTNGGKNTYIQVVNKTNQTKAIKIRFSEGVNTWETLDFNIFLSPWDVWTATIGQNKQGVSALITEDTSCTYPAIPQGGEDFKDTNLADDPAPLTALLGDAGKDDGKLSDKNRLLEGHFEIIEMAELNNPSANAIAAVIRGGGDPTDLPRYADWIKHNNGTPANCEAVAAASRSGGRLYENNDAVTIGRRTWLDMRTIQPPTGGLFGQVEIIDVANGISRGYDAVAIQNLFSFPAGSTPAGERNRSAMSPAGNSFPNLNGEVWEDGKVLDVGNKVAQLFKTDASGKVSVITTKFDRTVDAVSAVLSVDKIMNTYVVGDDLAAATDWVVSFPTKHFYVNPDTAKATRGQNGYACAPEVNCKADKTTDVAALYKDNSRSKKWYYQAPFVDGFGVKAKIMIYDREESGITNETGFSPSATKSNRLPFEVNVLEFSKSRNVLASNLNQKLDEKFTAGWAVIELGDSKNKLSGNYHGSGTAFACVTGLPAIGFSTVEFKNGTLNSGSTLANYASLYSHKYSRNVKSPCSSQVEPI